MSERINNNNDVSSEDNPWDILAQVNVQSQSESTFDPLTTEPPWITEPPYELLNHEESSHEESTSQEADSMPPIPTNPSALQDEPIESVLPDYAAQANRNEAAPSDVPLPQEEVKQEMEKPYNLDKRLLTNIEWRNVQKSIEQDENPDRIKKALVDKYNEWEQSEQQRVKGISEPSARLAARLILAERQYSRKRSLLKGIAEIDRLASLSGEELVKETARDNGIELPKRS
jgi:hypothetical protein